MNLKRFSVATFNLYNLQLPGEDMNPRQTPWTEAEYKRKLDWTARQLHQLKADIVGFQELWHAEPLEKMLAQSGLDQDYDLLATEAVGTKITCAAIVRKGLLQGDPQWISEFPENARLESDNDPLDPQAPHISVTLNEFSRPVLNVQVSLRDDQPQAEVFVAHLKSKLPAALYNESWYRADPDAYKPHATALGAGISTIRRTAEAVALRMLLTDVMKGTTTPVLVLGDLNDGQHSNTINILTEQPGYLVGGSTGGVDNGLYTAQTLQEYRDTRDVYYTHVHQDLRESLDHILLSEQFYDNSRKRLWLFDGLVINNDHLNYDDHKAVGSGDHGVVQVYFKHDPA
jgi:endonuclease/exonuclease/phosphatase family metal-dependent hydrolase